MVKEFDEAEIEEINDGSMKYFGDCKIALTSFEKPEYFDEKMKRMELKYG